MEGDVPLFGGLDSGNKTPLAQSQAHCQTRPPREHSVSLANQVLRGVSSKPAGAPKER